MKSFIKGLWGCVAVALSTLFISLTGVILITLFGDLGDSLENHQRFVVLLKLWLGSALSLVLAALTWDNL